MNSDSPVVRRAKAHDAAAIAALQVRSWQAAYRGIVPDASLDDLAEGAWLERWTGQLTAAGREGVHQLVSIDARQGPPRAIAACGPAMEPTAEFTGQLYVLYAAAMISSGVRVRPEERAFAGCAGGTEAVTASIVRAYPAAWQTSTVMPLARWAVVASCPYGCGHHRASDHGDDQEGEQEPEPSDRAECHPDAGRFVAPWVRDLRPCETASRLRSLSGTGTVTRHVHGRALPVEGVAPWL